MNNRKLVWTLVAFWAAMYCWSIFALTVTPATGDGFTRGLNRVAAFFGWQMVAGCLSVAIWYFGRVFEKGTAVRWLSRLPLALASLLFLACLGLFLYGNFSRPPADASLSPNVDPQKVTAPAVDLPTE